MSDRFEVRCSHSHGLLRRNDRALKDLRAWSTSAMNRSVGPCFHLQRTEEGRSLLLTVLPCNGHASSLSSILKRSHCQDGISSMWTVDGVALAGRRMAMGG